jgi:hypothetical protein
VDQKAEIENLAGRIQGNAGHRLDIQNELTEAAKPAPAQVVGIAPKTKAVGLSRPNR